MSRLSKYKVGLYFVLLTSIFISLSGCDYFFTKASIEKDKNEQRETLDGLFVTYWKGAKISIRSVPIDRNTQSIDFRTISQQQTKDLMLGKHLGKIFSWEAILSNTEPEDRQVFTTKEFIEFGHEIYTMAGAIETIDEDDYPTVAEIIHHSSRILQNRTVEMPNNWSNSMDHWLFALVMESRIGFGSWKTYELEKVKPEELVTSDYRVAATLHKGIDHLRNQWYYLADESFTRAITEANNPDIKLQDHSKELLVKAKIGDFAPEEQFKLVTRASSYLLRGFSRHQADSDELNEIALGDIESAIADFHRLGVENELVWIAESYVYINKEEKAKAIASLTKLENSHYLTDKERTLIAQAKEQVNDRHTDNALNILTDKIIIYRISLSCAMSYAEEIQWMQLLAQTKQGRKILQRFTELEQTYEKAEAYFDLDALKNKGQALFKDLTD